MDSSDSPADDGSGRDMREGGEMNDNYAEEIRILYCAMPEYRWLERAADYIEQKEAQLAELEAQLAFYDNKCPTCKTPLGLLAESECPLCDARQQLAEAQKDAERYRWIRIWRNLSFLHEMENDYATVDAAIDAAMGSE